MGSFTYLAGMVISASAAMEGPPRPLSSLFRTILWLTRREASTSRTPETIGFVGLQRTERSRLLREVTPWASAATEGLHPRRCLILLAILHLTTLGKSSLRIPRTAGSER